MSRLGSFLLSEKFIIDQSGKPSLIGIFQKITSHVPDGQEVPKEAMAALPWVIFTEWFFSEEERQQQWTQAIEVLLPDGSATPIRGKLKITSLDSSGLGSRCYVSLLGMPIAKQGLASVNVWLENDSEQIVSEVHTYRLTIEHTNTLLPTGGQAPVMTLIPHEI